MHAHLGHTRRGVQRVNAADPDDTSGIVRLRDFFYWREHLVLVTELLHLNLYQCLKRAAELAEPYFTVPRVQAIARQVRPWQLRAKCVASWR